MIYTFSNTIFTNLSEPDLELLDEIWGHSKEKHFLFIGDSKNWNVIQQSKWYAGLRPMQQQQIQLQYEASFRGYKHKSKMIIGNEAKDHFSLREAHEVLHKSLRIYLENIEYDKYFMDALAKHFKTFGDNKEPNKMANAYQKGWLEYENAGGTNILQVIPAKKDRFEANKIDFPKESFKYLRFFILLDSDKKYPADLVKSKKTFFKTIEDSKIPHHMLVKREIENYLPDAIHKEIPDYEDNIDFRKSYLNLKPVQKDFFDMQNGFPNVNFNNLDKEIQALYAGVSEQDKKIFRDKKYSFLDENGTKDSFKYRFAALFSSPNLTRAQLEQRADSKELEELIKKINDLL
jgi:hypothetical protein